MAWRRWIGGRRPGSVSDAAVSRHLIGASLLIAIGSYILLFGPWTLGARLDNLAYDRLLAARAEAGLGGPALTIVEIDDASLEREGQWPWPRHRVARLVDAVREGGARVLALDLLFAEPDRLSLGRLQDSVRRDLNVDLVLHGVQPALLDNDAALAASLSRVPSVMGMWYGFDGNGRLPAGDAPASRVAVVREKGAPAVLPVPAATQALHPTPVLAGAARAVGFINVLPDADGVVRRIPLLIRHADRVQAALSLATVGQALGTPQVIVRVSAAGVEEVRAGGRALPTDRQGSLLLPFGKRTGQAFRRVSARDVLDGRADPRSFRDRIVLVGASAAAEGDAQPTPFDRRLPGVLLHAVAIDAMLRGEFIRRPSWEIALQAFLVLVSVALPTAVLLRGSLLSYAVLSAVAALAWWFGARTLLVRYGLYVSPVPPLLALGGAVALLGPLRFRAEERAAFQRARELVAAQDWAITGLAAVAETRDPETGYHIIRTRAYVRALAEHLAANPRYRTALAPDMLDLIVKSAPLHDIGKVGVPDAILLKPGPLTEAEMSVMRRHAAMGQRVLHRAEDASRDSVSGSFLHTAGEMAGAHHERWNGSGYPLGLQGERIPLSARLMAVADVYDALCTRRPYKDPMTHESAASVIEAGSGNAFDPAVVQAFLAVQATFADIARRHADEE